MNSNTTALVGKKVGFNDNGTCLPLYTITKFGGKNYYRTYDDGTGEWMPTDILLKKINNSSLLVEGFTRKDIEAVCAGRTKTAQEKAFDKQLDKAENPHKYMREY